MWYFKVLGQRLSNVLLRFFPLIFVTSFLPKPFGLGLPISFFSFVLFVISLSVGTLLVTALTVLYPIITLTTMNEKGLVNLMITMADILSGLVVPIPFFPVFLQKISRLLPFQYISDLPFRIYVGNVGIIPGIFGVSVQLIWLFILIFMGLFLMKKSLRRVVVQGG